MELETSTSLTSTLAKDLGLRSRKAVIFQRGRAATSQI